MKIIIEGKPEEIAALAAELRERQGIDVETLAKESANLIRQNPQPL